MSECSSGRAPSRDESRVFEGCSTTPVCADSIAGDEPIDIRASLPGLPRTAARFLGGATEGLKSDKSCPQARQEGVFMGLYVSHCPQAIPISNSINAPVPLRPRDRKQELQASRAASREMKARLPV